MDEFIDPLEGPAAGPSVLSVVEDPVQVREQVRAVLVLAQELLGEQFQAFDGLEGPFGVSQSRQALARAARAVHNALATTAPEAAQRRAVLRALSLQLRFVGLSVGRADHAGGALADVEVALRRLRSMTSVSELAGHAPAELGRLGFTRVLMSRIEDGVWITESAYARGDKALAGALVAAGQQRPRRLSGELYETQMVRHQRSMLVRDPRRSAHVHTELVVLTQTQAYVAAPLLRGARACGLLHADKDGDAGTVSDGDQQLLAVFSEGLGQALERAACFQRIRQLKTRLDAQLSAAGDLIEEFLAVESPSRLAPTNRIGPTQPDEGHHVTAASPSRGARLTDRERGILSALVEGKTNAQIAQCLFVSESTVKYHVRNILRKMGASNRAEAVARFLRT